MVSVVFPTLKAMNHTSHTSRTRNSQRAGSPRQKSDWAAPWDPHWAPMPSVGIGSTWRCDFRSQIIYPIGSMYGIFTVTFIYHENQLNVGKHSIHGSYGYIYTQGFKSLLNNYRWLKGGSLANTVLCQKKNKQSRKAFGIGKQTGNNAAFISFIFNKQNRTIENYWIYSRLLQFLFKFYRENAAYIERFLINFWSTVYLLEKNTFCTWDF